MRFLEPGYLSWLWLALVPVVLWLFRRRARRVQVSTLLFFRSLAREHQESAWLRQLKRWLSLLMTLLVIIGVVLALARPTSDSGESGAAGLVLLLDHSASMFATEDGKTRLERAKDTIRARVKSARDSVVLSLISYANEAEVLLSRSRNKRELLRLLDEVQAVPAEDNGGKAWDAATRLAVLDAPAEVFHAGDSELAYDDAAAGVKYVWSDAAGAVATNVGITGFNLRVAPLERNRYEAFLRVAAAAANASEVSATVEVKIGGRLGQLREIKLKAGEESSLMLPLDGVNGEKLEVRISSAGDAMGLDNVLLATLPRVNPLTVAWLANDPDPFTELALSAMVDAGRVEMWKGGPENWPVKDKPDVLVLENWLPADAAPEMPMVLLSPSGGSGSWLRGDVLPGAVPVDRIRVLSPGHALLHGVSASRLSVTQTVNVSGPVGLEKLWLGGDQSLLLAGEINGKRAVVTSFSPSKSETLALQPAYPLLLANAIFWCAESATGRADMKALRVGDLVQAEGELRWETWDGNSVVPVTDSIKGKVAVVNHIGTWETKDGQHGYSVLASPRETDLRERVADETVAANPASRWTWGGGSLLLWAVLGLVVLESWLFHRQAVY